MRSAWPYGRPFVGRIWRGGPLRGARAVGGRPHPELDAWERRSLAAMRPRHPLQTFQRVGGPLPAAWERRSLPANRGALPWPPVESTQPIPSASSILEKLTSLVPSSDPLFSPRPPRVGVNNPKFFIYEKSGSFAPEPEISGDLANLGVRFVRQPGNVDMQLDRLAGQPLPVDFADLENNVRRSEPLAYLEELVRSWHAAGRNLKTRITFLTLGSPPAPAVSHPIYQNPLPFSWEGHEGRIVTGDDGSPVPFDANPGQGDWDRLTMDPANPYKRIYYREVARILGAALEEMRLRLEEEGIDLTNFLDGIEIGNELSNRHYIRNPDDTDSPDGESWGQLYYECATALIDEAGWLRCYLPGLRPYDPTKGEREIQSWATRVEFVDGMLREIQNQLAAAKGKRVPALEDLVAGVDVHHYNHAEGDAEFLSYLAADLGELRKLFDGFVTGWRPTISVFESGVNVACTNPQNKHKGVAPDVVPGVDGGCEAGVPTTDATPSFRPRVFDPATGADLGTMGARDFAGASAWIRLAVAYAAGADAFGWHTHMSDPNTAFAGMGLREDTEDDKNDYTKAQPRPSWHAVQRFVELLGNAADARILFPSIGESHEKHADLIKSSSPDLMAPWAIEFSFLHSPLGIYDQWAYLLFVDPYATVDKATTGVKLADPLFYTFTLKDRTGSATGITQVNLPPTSFNPSTSPKTLPPSTYAAGATVSVLPTSGNTYVFSDVQPGQYPILLFSPRQLDVDAEPTQKT